jgi:hypothetical protein
MGDYLEDVVVLRVVRHNLPLRKQPLDFDQLVLRDVNGRSLVLANQVNLVVDGFGPVHGRKRVLVPLHSRLVFLLRQQLKLRKVSLLGCNVISAESRGCSLLKSINFLLDFPFFLCKSLEAVLAFL